MRLAPSSSNTDAGRVAARCSRLPPFTSRWLLWAKAICKFYPGLSFRDDSWQSTALGQPAAAIPALLRVEGLTEATRLRKKQDTTSSWDPQSLQFKAAQACYHSQLGSLTLSLWHKDLSLRMAAVTLVQWRNGAKTKLASYSSKHRVHSRGH